MKPCAHCGTVTPSTRCPSCGARITARTPAGWAALGLTLMACAGGPGTETAVALYGMPACETDVDGDGFCAELDDCDDDDPDVHPGAEETVDDGVDSNCDGDDNT